MPPSSPIALGLHPGCTMRPDCDAHIQCCCVRPKHLPGLHRRCRQPDRAGTAKLLSSACQAEICFLVQPSAFAITGQTVMSPRSCALLPRIKNHRFCPPVLLTSCVVLYQPCPWSYRLAHIVELSALHTGGASKAFHLDRPFGHPAKFTARGFDAKTLSRP